MLLWVVNILSDLISTYEPLLKTVVTFWNPYFITGDLLMLWALIVWGIHVEETRLQLLFDFLGTFLGSIVVLVTITVGLGAWVLFLFQTTGIHTLPAVWYGINPLRLLPTAVPIMIAGGVAGIATELLTGTLE